MSNTSRKRGSLNLRRADRLLAYNSLHTVGRDYGSRKVRKQFMAESELIKAAAKVAREFLNDVRKRSKQDIVYDVPMLVMTPFKFRFGGIMDTAELIAEEKKAREVLLFPGNKDMTSIEAAAMFLSEKDEVMVHLTTMALLLRERADDDDRELNITCFKEQAKALGTLLWYGFHQNAANDAE